LPVIPRACALGTQRLFSNDLRTHSRTGFSGCPGPPTPSLRSAAEPCLVLPEGFPLAADPLLRSVLRFLRR
jgi:hypothetical protein